MASQIMDSTAANKQHNSRISLTVPLIVIIIVILDSSLSLGLVPRLVTRFCYNSPNPTQVNSQCVLCNYYLFDSTLLGCTGSTALNINITAAQAFCVISNCLGQVRQSPIFLGRKKRSEDTIQTLEPEEDRHSGNENIIAENHLKVKEYNDRKSTEIVDKYNQNEQFIVAKEVEALIIDLPEPMDETVLSV